jgi:hypothetical protein
LQNGTLNLLPTFADPALRSVLAFGNIGQALGNTPVGGILGSAGLPVGSGSTSGGSSGSSGSGGLLTTGQGDRCPGSQERGAVFYPESGFPCNPKQVPTGK